MKLCRKCGIYYAIPETDHCEGCARDIENRFKRLGELTRPSPENCLPAEAIKVTKYKPK